nr:putative ribonuclease H-like domain-containing protein [Tanacetum cinerariifolium]
MTDYSLWEVILNGDSLAPTRVIDGVLQPAASTTAEQRLARKNELKARGTLLMALPDKHQLKFNTHKDTKTLMEVIEKRLQKLITQLEILRVSLLQEDINLKFLRSLPTEWRTHTLIWRNKTDLEEQSLDDLFNNLKIYEAEVKSSSSVITSTLNIAFVSSSNTDSTNEQVSTAASVSAISAKLPVSVFPNVDSLSNVVIYLFFASQSTSPQFDNDNLKQIDADDLEEIDLKWQMAMLTRTGKNLRENGPTSMGFDMSKVECYNCHRKGHFVRECRSPKDTKRNGAAEPQMRNVPVETSTSNALVSQCDGVGSYDWKDYRKSQFDVISYQTRLESVEDRLLVYQQNESIFEEDIKLLKLEVQLKDNALVVLRQNLEKAKQERDDLKLKLEKFQTSSKSLSELLASQTNDKTGLGYNSQVFTRVMFDCDDYLSSVSDESLPPSLIYDRYQSGNGYHVVPPPYTGTFMPPKPDLVFNNAPNDVETDHSAFIVKINPTKPDQDLSHTHRPSAHIIKDWVSYSKDESKTKSPQNIPSFVQPTEQVKSPRPSVQHVETSIPTATPKTAIPKPTSNGKCKNRKACFVCKSLDHLIKDCNYHDHKMAQTPPRNHAPRRHHKNYARMPLSNPQRHVVPPAVLTKSKLVSITAIRPVSTVVPKINVTRLIQAKTIITKSNSPPRRHITRSPSPKASTFPSKVTAGKALMVIVAKGIQVSNGLGPKEELTIIFLVHGNPQHALKDKEVIDSGCSRHMTGNMSYLSDFEELNGRYVAFGGNPKGGKISGKGKIRTGKLDFDDVYFIKELKFNLFSVSQMCDKKNNVLFTDIECLVLSPDFKLPDASQVLLRVPRENNMNNVNLQNIVPFGDLTCLFAKATLDESNLWYRRLGHINFKTMNKLVKGNLVRGLPSKVFENDHTCVACKKGKQHRASCKTKHVSSVNQPLHRLHMDLFRPTFVKSLNKKSYCLVVTNDYSRFT